MCKSVAPISGKARLPQKKSQGLKFNSSGGIAPTSFRKLCAGIERAKQKDRPKAVSL
jgi:hypothetical protein